MQKYSHHTTFGTVLVRFFIFLIIGFSLAGSVGFSCYNSLSSGVRSSPSEIAQNAHSNGVSETGGGR